MGETSLSLLQRLQGRTDNESWARLVDLYSPLIRGWLRRNSMSGQDADDVVQEILSVVFRRMPDFERNERTGSFRAWLRTITVNCLRDFWKSQRRRQTSTGGNSTQDMLSQLEDEQSELSHLWNREHDRHVTNYLLELIRSEFSEQTWQAFQKVAVDGEAAKPVAEALGMTVNAVYIARSRVLTRLRLEGQGLLESEFSPADS